MQHVLGARLSILWFYSFLNSLKERWSTALSPTGKRNDCVFSFCCFTPNALEISRLFEKLDYYSCVKYSVPPVCTISMVTNFSWWKPWQCKHISWLSSEAGVCPCKWTLLPSRLLDVTLVSPATVNVSALNSVPCSGSGLVAEGARYPFISLCSYRVSSLWNSFGRPYFPVPLLYIMSALLLLSYRMSSSNWPL